MNYRQCEPMNGKWMKATKRRDRVREKKMMLGENERCEEVGCFKLFHNTILFDEDIHKSENINLQLRNNIIYV